MLPPLASTASRAAADVRLTWSCSVTPSRSASISLPSDSSLTPGYVTLIRPLSCMCFIVIWALASSIPRST